jgi:hypothetical protein
VPYRKASEADLSKQAISSASPSPSSSQQPRPSSPNNSKGPPKITPIPRIIPFSSLRSELPAGDKAQSASFKPRHETLAQGLEGKFVDEFGNVLDWDGTVLGRVEGDLPSMVGRPVSCSGEILDTDGEIAGYVSDNYIEPGRQELDGGLQADDEGNIYNKEGAVIGKLNKPPKKEAKESWLARSSARGDGSDAHARACSCTSPAAPKPSSAPNLSGIYLDVKSTFDGIQIIIKIPTILNRDHDCVEHEREKTQEEQERYRDHPKEDGHSHQ